MKLAISKRFAMCYLWMRNGYMDLSSSSTYFSISPEVRAIFLVLVHNPKSNTVGEKWYNMCFEMKKDVFFSIAWQWKSGKEWKADNNISLGLLLFGQGDPDVSIKSPRNPYSTRPSYETRPPPCNRTVCIHKEPFQKSLVPKKIEFSTLGVIFYFKILLCWLASPWAEAVINMSDANWDTGWFLFSCALTALGAKLGKFVFAGRHWEHDSNYHPLVFQARAIKSEGCQWLLSLQ